MDSARDPIGRQPCVIADLSTTDNSLRLNGLGADKSGNGRALKQRNRAGVEFRIGMAPAVTDIGAGTSPL